ncbi:MAG: hypothetical protein ABSH52_30545 [Terriglobia bacterium]|jgi:hypothetical protein
MLEELALAGFCLLATLVGLAIAAWEVISGRVFNMDGLWFTLISLTLSAVFGGALAWSFYSGDGQKLLRSLKKGPALEAGPDKSQPKPT